MGGGILTPGAALGFFSMAIAVTVEGELLATANGLRAARA